MEVKQKRHIFDFFHVSQEKQLFYVLECYIILVISLCLVSQYQGADMWSMFDNVLIGECKNWGGPMLLKLGW